MTLMNQVLRPFLDKFVVVYLDDILIYSKSPEEHAQHVEAVLSALEQHHLYAKASKCQFGMAELDFLGHTISGAGIKVDARKVKAILEWPEPSDAHQLRCFLGLAGFYRRFVNNFSHIAAPLTNITGAKATWRWSEVEAKAFADLKQALTTTPVLATPDWTPWSELRHTLPSHRRGRPIRPTNVAPIWSSKLATKFYCPDATCAMASWTLCGWGPIPSRSASRAQPIAWVYPPT